MIPKLIHHSAPKSRKKWHPIWENCLNSWYINYPQGEYEHIMWDDEKIDCFIEEKFEKYFLVYNALPFHIMKLDMFRLCLMYEYGGLYKDMDYYCYENFYNDITKDIAIVRSPCTETSMAEYFQNSLYVSTPQKTFWLDVIDYLIERYRHYTIIRDVNDKSFNNYVLTVTGPILFNHIREDNPLLLKEVQELPYENYNPIISTYNNKEEMKNVKCMHFLSGMWGSDSFTKLSQDLNMYDRDMSQWLLENYLSKRGIDLTNFDG